MNLLKSFSIIILLSLLLITCSSSTDSKDENSDNGTIEPTDPLYIPGDKLILAGSDGSIYQLSENRIDWIKKYINSNLRFISITKVADGYLASNYFITYSDNGSIYKLRDGSSEWVEVYNNHSIYNLLTLPNGHILGTTNYAGKGIIKSIDNGVTWTKTNMPDLSTIKLTMKDDVILVSVLGEGVYKSIDNGDNWEKVTTEPKSLYINDILFLPNGELLGVSSNSISYKSADNGVTWVKKSFPLGYYDNLLYNNNTIFAGGSSGILMSDDNGESWIETNCQAKVYSLANLPTGEILAGLNKYNGDNKGIVITSDNFTTCKETGLKEGEIYSILVDK